MTAPQAATIAAATHAAMAMRKVMPMIAATPDMKAVAMKIMAKIAVKTMTIIANMRAVAMADTPLPMAKMAAAMPIAAQAMTMARQP